MILMVSASQKLKTIDEYLADVNADQRAALEQLRGPPGVAPKTKECISCGIPAFRFRPNVTSFFKQLPAQGWLYFLMAMKLCSLYLFTILQLTLISAMGEPAPSPVRDGSHDFDFLIGNWKAHVRRLPDRLVGSNAWIEYNGISNHKKVLDTDANFEEFEVDNPEKHLHIKGQTLRLYNPDSHQWSIYLLDLDKGVLSVPPVIGEFNGNRGEFYDQEQYKGRAILVRYIWLNISPKSARMEQSFSADGGKTWETNWICELTR
jgi:hypothetical protein